MKLTINNPDNQTNKAIPLIEYLNSIDFITVEQDENSVIPDWQKQMVRDRLLNSKPDNLLDWENVKDTFKLD